jgi:RNA polymerase sigma-70 factor (ECF subfamily)
MKKFQQFYTDNGEKLFGYLLRKIGDRQQAADLLQETFTRYLEKYRGQELSVALLFTISRNLFYDQLRYDRRWVHSENTDLQSTTDQEKDYLVKETAMGVFAALQLLDEEERDILALVVSSGLSYREIAEIRQCSVANIKVKVHRARLKLKKILQEKSDG